MARWTAKVEVSEEEKKVGEEGIGEGGRGEHSYYLLHLRKC